MSPSLGADTGRASLPSAKAISGLVWFARNRREPISSAYRLSSRSTSPPTQDGSRRHKGHVGLAVSQPKVVDDPVDVTGVGKAHEPVPPAHLLSKVVAHHPHVPDLEVLGDARVYAQHHLEYRPHEEDVVHVYLHNHQRIADTKREDARVGVRLLAPLV